MLTVDRVSLTYERSGLPVAALRAVTFSIAAGERIGLVGASGSGKSTLGRVCMGLERPTTGTVVYDGQSVHGATKRHKRRYQPVFQDSTTALDPRLTIEQSLVEPYVIQGLRYDRAQPRALLDMVQLPASVASRRPRELSVGQRQRVCLARALALSPELIWLDEPVASLDVSVQAQILTLLDSLVRERRMTLVLVSHDADVVNMLCSRILRMHDGELR